MKNSIEKTLMETAGVFAGMSLSTRTQVGCVISRGGRIIATGYNGTLPGEDNCCEDADGKTKDTVMHAEQNAFMFCAKEGLSTAGCEIFITMSPCVFCAKLIIMAGIEKVYFRDWYTDPAGVQLLEDRGIEWKTIRSIS